MITVTFFSFLFSDETMLLLYTTVSFLLSSLKQKVKIVTVSPLMAFFICKKILYLQTVITKTVLAISQDLANEILSMFTAREMGKVFFTNSGSEANDSQVCSATNEYVRYIGALSLVKAPPIISSNANSLKIIFCC
jgi:hypothetical protein